MIILILNIFLIATWGILGGGTIAFSIFAKEKDVPLFSYVLCWIVLMLELFRNFFQ